MVCRSSGRRPRRSLAGACGSRGLPCRSGSRLQEYWRRPVVPPRGGRHRLHSLETNPLLREISDLHSWYDRQVDSDYRDCRAGRRAAGHFGTQRDDQRQHALPVAGAIQQLGVVQIAAGAGEDRELPGYIEIANLRVQEGFKSNTFTAENGSRAPYDGFAACIYARSVQHLVVRNNVLTDCGLGFYNWTGSGTAWWDGLQMDTMLRGNYFYNNGNPGSYTEHQSY